MKPHTARSPSLDAVAWNNFKAHWSKCEACKLKEGKCVFGSGPARSGLAVVTLSPTLEDAALNTAVSPSTREYIGFILDVLGVSIENVWFTHVVLCASPLPLAPKRSMAMCAERLAAECKLVGIRSLVFVGNGDSLPFINSERYTYPSRTSPTLNSFEVSPEVSVPIFSIPPLLEVIENHPRSPLASSPLSRSIRTLALAIAAAKGGRKEAATAFGSQHGQVWAEANAEFSRRWVGRAPSLVPDLYGSDETFQSRAIIRLERLRYGGENLRYGDVTDLLGEIRGIFFGSGGTFRMKKTLDQRGWETIVDKEVSNDHLTRHLGREIVLSSFAPKEIHTMPLDIDRHSEIQIARLDETLALVHERFRRGFSVRSSHSGGVHRWIAFNVTQDFEETKWLLRLKVQKMGLGIVLDSGVVYTRVEIPDQGCRVPFGAGSYPLAGDFSPDDPIGMLEAFLDWANDKRNRLSKRDFFAAELAAVNRLLKSKHPNKSTWTADERASAARELYYRERKKIIPDLPASVVSEALLRDPHGSWFLKAPDYIKQLYVGGIPGYGMRTTETKKLATWLVICGLPNTRVEEILEAWLLTVPEHRRHLSKDLSADPQGVIDDLELHVQQARRYWEHKGRKPGAVTTGDLRWLVDHLASCDTRPAEALERNLRRRKGVSLKSPSKGEATLNHHRLNMALEMIRLLRSGDGERTISSKLLRKWGGREYQRHLKHWSDEGLVEACGVPHRGVSRDFRLLLEAQAGEPVASLQDGLGTILDEAELRALFPTAPRYWKRPRQISQQRRTKRT